MTTIDRHLERWVVHHRVGWLNPVVVDLTRIASDGLVFVLVGLVLALLWRRPWFLVLLVAADLAAGGALARPAAVDRPLAPAARVRRAAAARADAAHRLVPVRPLRDRVRLRDGDRVGLPAAGAAGVRARRADRLVAGLRRRPLAARRARRRGARRAGRYSSSEARSKPATITPRLASRLIQMPIPRPAGGGIESGIEIRRIRTKIVASDPSAITTRLSGTDGGSSNPNSRATASPISTRPITKTSLPSVPVCHAITARVGPAVFGPAYQSVKAEIVRTSPAIQASRPPSAQKPVAAGRGKTSSSGSKNGSCSAGGKGSGVCTRGVWAFFDLHFRTRGSADVRRAAGEACPDG